MRAHIFLQRPAAVPLESACLAVVTHRQTLVFCASFPGGDFFGACPKPLRAMHGRCPDSRGWRYSGPSKAAHAMVLPALVFICAARPKTGAAHRPGHPAGPAARPLGAQRMTFPLELDGHSPNPGQPAQARQEGGWPVGRQKASAGSWAQVRSRALTTCSQAVIWGNS